MRTAGDPDPLNSAKSMPRLAVNTGTKIRVNDLLPTYKNIVAELHKRELVIDGLFGTTSQGANIPSTFLLTFTPGADLDMVRAAIRASTTNGLEAIRRSTGNMFGAAIYIGSYSYEKEPVRQKLSSAQIDNLLLLSDADFMTSIEQES